MSALDPTVLDSPRAEAAAAAGRDLGSVSGVAVFGMILFVCECANGGSAAAAIAAAANAVVAAAGAAEDDDPLPHESGLEFERWMMIAEGRVIIDAL